MDCLEVLKKLKELRDSDLTDTEKLHYLVLFANNDLDELIEILAEKLK